MRRIASLTASLSLLVMFLTSVILFIVPQGRVAYWADWRLWGLSKEQWGAIHINVGLLFLLSLALHLYYNWKPLVLYLKNKARRIKVFTREFNIALAITALTVAGSYAGLPPFSSLIDLGDTIKDAAAQRYGEPPYGHAELSSLKSFARKMGLDPDAAAMRLEQAGYLLEDDTLSLKEIARRNNVSPQRLYQAMRPTGRTEAGPPGGGKLLPENPPPGTGNLTLADFARQHDLDLQAIVTRLDAVGIAARQDMTIKQIGESNNTGPVDIYDRLRAIAEKPM